MAQPIYKGFSTQAWLDTGFRFSTSNIETVKRDILNHIYTIKGERLMMPEFGTRIPLMVFEPNDERTRAAIEADLREVVNYDPRVKLIAMSVVSLPDNNAIMALVDLYYIEFNVTDTLRIEIATNG
ncbi:MAG: GPW/gp25 family protein [Candidatus Nitrosotenuis sp.]